MGWTLQPGKAQYGAGLAAAVGLDGVWLEFIFGGVWCVLRGLRGDWWGSNVRERSDRVWDCVWDGEIDETEIEERKI